MAEVLAASLAFPTLIYTVVLALALIYWLFVIVGAVDLDGAHVHGHVPEGALDGVAKGALEGTAKGALEGVAKGAAEGAAKGAAEHLGGGDQPSLPAIIAALRLDRAPATVVLTFLAAFGWLGSVLATITLGHLWADSSLRWLFGALVLLASALVALPLTALAIRPIAPLFATRTASARKDLVGKVAVISTGRVDARFGQATLEDGGSGLILDVRCDTEGALKRGDRALIVSWEPEREAFVVEPLDDLIPATGAEKLRVSAGASPASGSGAEEAAESEDTAARRHAG